jgi:hypothetical protein
MHELCLCDLLDDEEAEPCQMPVSREARRVPGIAIEIPSHERGFEFDIFAACNEFIERSKRTVFDKRRDDALNHQGFFAEA